MSKSGVQANFYLGVVSKVKENFQIEADIPGIILGVNAYPLRGDCDEPKENDPVILLGLDPEFNSYYLYWKLKENDFTGFRAYGNEISIEDGKLVIRTYSGDNTDDPEHEPGEEKTRIELDKEGKITVIARDAEIKVQNKANIDATTANISIIDGVIGSSSGSGVLEVKTTGVIPEATGGPFLATNITPPQGSPLPSGKTLILGKL